MKVSSVQQMMQPLSAVKAKPISPIAKPNLNGRLQNIQTNGVDILTISQDAMEKAEQNPLPSLGEVKLEEHKNPYSQKIEELEKMPTPLLPMMMERL